MFDRRNLKNLVSTAYQLQSERISIGLRVVGNAKIRLGQQPGEKEEDLDENAKEILAQLRESADRISDVLGGRVVRKGAAFPEDGLLTNAAEYCLAKVYFTLLEQEEYTFKTIGSVIADHPMMPWFEKVSGVGTALAAVMLSQIDMSPERTPNLGSLYAYCGLDVVVTEKEVDGVIQLVGEARSRKAHHLVDRAYIDAKGEEATRKSISYNKFLHDKLLGVGAECLIKAGGYFKTEVFNNYKFRLLNAPAHLKKSDDHINNMSRRYMIKIMIMYFFEEYCRVMGRELPPLYHEKKLKLFHSGELFQGDTRRTPEKTEQNRAAALRLKEAAEKRHAIRIEKGIIANRRVTVES